MVTEFVVVWIVFGSVAVPLFRTKPAGSAPLVIVHVKGPMVAGFTVSVWFTAVPTISVNAVGVIASAGVDPIVNVKGKGAEEVEFESVTVAVPEIVAVARGVPEIVTVLPLPAGGKVRVAGNPVMFQVNGATPPVTVSVPL
jgi:hypothetical protein